MHKNNLLYEVLNSPKNNQVDFTFIKIIYDENNNKKIFYLINWLNYFSKLFQKTKAG